MARLFLVLTPVLALATACSTTVGPPLDELADALELAPSLMSSLRCNDILEEPTEFRCRYRLRDAAGGRIAQEVMVAIDGSTWVIIDGPSAPYRP